MVICVYCSANNNVGEEYKQLAADLGQWIAQHGHSLMFGGATGGLMTAVSEAAAAEHGDVIGVLPQRILSAGRESMICTEKHIVRTMNERKDRFKHMADVFVCLPGSYGTLDEMFDVIASGTVGEHHKPMLILNYKGFYEPLREQISKMKELNFIPKQEVYTPVFVDTKEQLFTELLQLKAE